MYYNQKKKKHREKGRRQMKFSPSTEALLDTAVAVSHVSNLPCQTAEVKEKQDIE